MDNPRIKQPLSKRLPEGVLALKIYSGHTQEVDLPLFNYLTPMPPLTLLKTIPLTSEKGLDPQSFLLDNQPRTVTHPPYKGEPTIEQQIPKLRMEARIIRWVDADTLVCHPYPYHPELNLKVRLKDSWQPELDEEGHDQALEEAKALLGDTDSEIVLTNDRHRWTYGRLEARVDPLP